jgi:hypothetical protein
MINVRDRALAFQRAMQGVGVPARSFDGMMEVAARV